MTIIENVETALIEKVNYCTFGRVKYFNCEDLCNLLGIKDPFDILDDDEYFNLDGVTYLYSAGLFNLIGSCELPLDPEERKAHPAYPYQRWLFHEVLPTIRKTGKYNFLEA